MIRLAAAQHGGNRYEHAMRRCASHSLYSQQNLPSQALSLHKTRVRASTIHFSYVAQLMLPSPHNLSRLQRIVCCVRQRTDRSPGYSYSMVTEA
jgi:hypothetical protein